MQTLHSLQICIGDDTPGDVTAAALTATDAGDALLVMLLFMF